MHAFCSPNQVSITLESALPKFARKGASCYCSRRRQVADREVFGRPQALPGAPAAVDTAGLVVSCGPMPWRAGGVYRCGVLLKPDPQMLS